MNEQEASMLAALLQSQQALTQSLQEQTASNLALSEAILALAQAIQQQNGGDEEEPDGETYLDGRPI